jgi:hypothetical protein
MTTLVAFQTARKYLNNTTRTVVCVSGMLNSRKNYLQRELCAPFKTKHCSEYLLILLKHHTKARNLLYDCSWSTYTAVKNLLLDGGLLNFRVFLKINTRICGRRQLFVQTCLEALTSVNRPLIDRDKLI